MNNYDDLFGDIDDMVNKQDTEQWIANKQAAYEEKVVRTIFNRFDLSQNFSYLKKLHKEETNNDYLSLARFRQLYTDFPLLLGAASTVFAHQITLSDLFKRFTNTQLYKRYEQLYEELSTETESEEIGACGLVFPWPHIGIMIIHNHTHLQSQGTRVTRPLKHDTLYIDSFNDILEQIAKIWKPE